MRKELPCLPLIQERFWNAIKDREICEDVIYPEFEMYMFPQTWGSTALGFDGIGGQAMTAAYTTVVEESSLGIYGVFFSEGLAYVIENPNDKFFEDLRNHCVVDCNSTGKYRRLK